MPQYLTYSFWKLDIDPTPLDAFMEQAKRELGLAIFDQLYGNGPHIIHIQQRKERSVAMGERGTIYHLRVTITKKSEEEGNEPQTEKDPKDGTQEV
jgi:hypothetical protein